MNINSKFYPVTSEVSRILRAAKLTAAEWRIWSYLIEIEPWGDAYQDISTLTVMQECNVSKATYYRALAKFQELELFDFQDKGISIRNLKGVSSLKNETEFSKMRQQSQECDSSLKNETQKSKMRKNSQKRENQTSKPFQNNNSSVPQTYSDFIQTLSFEERANFLNFCKEKTKNLSQEVNDIEAWLAYKNKAGQNRWEVYYQKFLEEQQTQSQKSKRTTSSPVAKKFQQEIEQQQQQAIQKWRGKA